MFSFGGRGERNRDAVTCDGCEKKKGEIGEFGTLVDILFGEREMEKEEETRYQESIGRKEGSLKIFFSRDEFVIYYLSSCNRYRRTADILEGR